MLYNIPFCSSFIDVFAKKILEDNKNTPENLYNYLIIVPNKRIIRNLQTAFLKNSNAKALILPKMISLSDLDYIISNNHLVFNSLSKDKFKDILLPTISKRERSFMLAKLIQKMDYSLSFNTTLQMADSLGNLIDRAYMEDVNFKDLDKIVDGNLAIHWQEILKFLHIATQNWPTILAEKQSIDIAYQQKLIYQIQNKIWQLTPPQNHVIALNITGFTSDTTNLLKTISELPKSDIYFYGIDYHIPEDDFKKLDFTHPQKVFSHMLSKLELKREKILDLGNKKLQENIIHRIFDKLIYKQVDQKNIKEFSNKFSIINAKNEEEEARTIALSLRETLESSGKTAGLITNNPNLISRVQSELKKWNIEIDDYLGNSLINSLQAKFFVILGNIIKNDFEPEDFLALLKHPLCTMGLSRGEILKYCQNLDFYLFRNLLNNKTIFGYKNELEHMEFLHKNIKTSLLSFLQHIEMQFSELLKLIKSVKSSKTIDFQKTLISHIEIAEKITSLENKEQSELWKDQEGRELSMLLSSLLQEGKQIGLVSIHEYMEIIKKSIFDVNIRSMYNKHPRLYIYGDMQNTLIHHDVIVLANLNEGSMPHLPQQNPWMNAHIMSQLGFIKEEASIGLKTNIFAQIIGAKEVILVRSEKDQGKLTTPSRWLLKLETFLNYYNTDDTLPINSKNYIYNIQKTMYTPKRFTPLVLDNVSYNPPHNFRPTKISATQLESLIKNPYIYFIERILKIRPLDKVNPSPNKKDCGNSLHKALELFFENLEHFKTLPLSIQYGELIKMMEVQFQTFLESATFKLFKMPIIKRGIYSFLTQENLDSIKKSYVEISGSINLKIGNTTINLNGKADRIDILNDNSINIFDYKTTASARLENYWKQLLILSLIFQQGGFFCDDVAEFNISSINTKYIFFPNKINDSLQKKDNNVADIVNYMPEFLQEIEKILEEYYVKNTPYIFNLADKKVYEEHKHFIRFDEWNTNLSLKTIDNAIDDGETN